MSVLQTFEFLCVKQRNWSAVFFSFREAYHAKKAEEKKQFKAETKAKVKQWVHILYL